MKYISSKYTFYIKLLLIAALIVAVILVVGMNISFVYAEMWVFAIVLDVVFIYLLYYSTKIVFNIKEIKIENLHVIVSGIRYRFPSACKVKRVLLLPYIFFIEEPNGEKIYFIPSISNLFSSFPESPDGVKFLKEFLQKNV